MSDQPDPPENWRVYEEDKTPDPEPPSAPPQVPYGDAPPNVPYGGGQPAYNPVFVTTSSSTSFAPKLILIMVAVAVLGGVVAAGIAILSTVGGVGGVGGIGGIDAKDPDDFAEVADLLEEERGTTEVFWVGLYTDYVIIDAPYTDDPGETREIRYSWRGGDDLEESSRGTSTDPQRFDLADIDPAVIEGMCDPVLELAEGATPDDCYIFISRPVAEGAGWFRASASDEFNQYFYIDYDKLGVEVARYPAAE